MPDSWIDKKELEELVGSLPSSKKGRRKRKALPRAIVVQQGEEGGLPKPNDAEPADGFGSGVAQEPPPPVVAGEETSERERVGDAQDGDADAIPEPQQVSGMTPLERIPTDPEAAVYQMGEFTFPESIFELDLQEEIEDHEATGPNLKEGLEAAVDADESGAPEEFDEPSTSATFLEFDLREEIEDDAPINPNSGGSIGEADFPLGPPSFEDFEGASHSELAAEPDFHWDSEDTADTAAARNSEGSCDELEATIDSLALGEAEGTSCPEEIEAPVIVEALDSPDERRRVPEFLEGEEEEAAEPVRRLTPIERDADRAFRALADARAKAELAGLLRTRGVPRGRRASVGGDGVSVSPSSELTEEQRPGTASSEEIPMEWNLDLSEPDGSEEPAGAEAHAENRGAAVLPESVEADEDSVHLPEPLEAEDCEPPSPESFDADELAALLPESPEAEDCEPPSPESFDADELAALLPESPEAEDCEPPSPESFEADELAALLPESPEAEDCEPPSPESFEADELAALLPESPEVEAGDSPLSEPFEANERAAFFPETFGADGGVKPLPETFASDEREGDVLGFGILEACDEALILETHEFEVRDEVFDRGALRERIFRLGERARRELRASGLVICDEHGLPLYISNEADGHAAPPAALLLELSGRTNESLGLGREGVIQITDGEGGWRCLLPSEGGVRPLYAGLSLERPLEHGEIERLAKALAAAVHPLPPTG